MYVVEIPMLFIKVRIECKLCFVRRDWNLSHGKLLRRVARLRYIYCTSREGYWVTLSAFALASTNESVKNKEAS